MYQKIKHSCLVVPTLQFRIAKVLKISINGYLDSLLGTILV